MSKVPGIDHLDAVRGLEKAGYRVLRQGKHIVMTDGSLEGIDSPTQPSQRHDDGRDRARRRAHYRRVSEASLSA